ncbi:MAG: TlpA family protein disulfide reductase, partial [Mariniphaga sp.]
MKKLLFTAFFLSVVLALNAQEIIENPRHGIVSTSYIQLTKVELTDAATILSFDVTIPQNNWVAIHEKSYIQPVGDTTRLYITKAEGAEIATQIHWEKGKREEISYSLYFPPVGKNVARIDFGEPVANSWNFYDIEIREVPDQSPVPARLRGHWFSEENGHWTFSLLDSLAVFAGKTWEYEDVTPSEDGFKINLVNKEEKQTLFCRTTEGPSCTMRSGNTPPAHYSKDTKQLDKISDPVPFDASSLNSGKVYYSGLIRGYSTRLGTQTGMIRTVNRLTNQQESIVIPIQKNGSFQVEFNLDFPQEITVSLPSGSERIFFEPGKPLFHLANPGLKAVPSLFAGESAAVNYGLNKTKEVGTPMMAFVDGIVNMTDEEYISHVLENKEKEQEKLARIQKENNLSAKAFQIRAFDIGYRAAHYALRYYGNINLAKIYANRDLKEEDKLPMGAPDFDVNLLQKLRDIPLHNELGIISNEYFNLLQAITYTDLKRPQSAYYYRMAILGEELQKKGIELTGEEVDMLEYIRLNLADNFDYEKSRSFNLSYREVIQKFAQKYQDEMLKLTRKFQNEYMKTNLGAMGLNPEGLPKEIFETQVYLASLKNETEEPDEKAYLRTRESLQNIRLKELVMAAYYQKRAELEVKNVASSNSTETEGDKLFSSIIRPYRGKVIYVDFWATWCGPCMAGIEKVKPLKDELTGKDIVFLYITNPSSPEAEYRKRIPEIKGEHVRVTADEWNYLTA